MFCKKSSRRCAKKLNPSLRRPVSQFASKKSLKQKACLTYTFVLTRLHHYYGTPNYQAFRLKFWSTAKYLKQKKFRSGRFFGKKVCKVFCKVLSAYTLSTPNCYLCKSFSSKIYIKYTCQTSQRSVHQDVQVPCNLCGKMFRKLYLSQHMKIVHGGEESKDKVCQYPNCFKAYKTKDHLRRHQKAKGHEL